MSVESPEDAIAVGGGGAEVVGLRATSKVATTAVGTLSSLVTSTVGASCGVARCGVIGSLSNWMAPARWRARGLCRGASRAATAAAAAAAVARTAREFRFLMDAVFMHALAFALFFGALFAAAILG